MILTGTLRDLGGPGGPGRPGGPGAPTPRSPCREGRIEGKIFTVYLVTCNKRDFELRVVISNN